jgi:hypothetical protein
VGQEVARRGDLGSEKDVSPVIRLPSWREVFEGPWAIRLRSGATGAWLMRGEAEEVAELQCRFVTGIAARTAHDALVELGSALELDEPPAGWDAVSQAVPDGPIALLMIDSERLLADEPEQLASLVGALRSAAARTTLRVIFQARELPLEAEAVLAEFGVEEIAA